MKRSLVTTLSLALGLLAAGMVVRAQDATSPPPPPPPHGEFFFGHERFLFEGLKPVSGAPFSAQATTETTQVLADGNQIKHTQTAILYRDSAGRTRREMTISAIGPWSTAAGPREMINISDPVAGTSYVLNPADKTAVRLPTAKVGPVSRQERRAERAQKREAATGTQFQRTTESLGNQQMAGVNVQGTRTTETIPAGAIGNDKPVVVVSERWYSPDLQMVVYSKRADPRFGTTVYQLTNITRDEPDAALFQVPSDYTIKDRPAFRRRQAPGSPQ
jgi:hypothetical protein